MLPNINNPAQEDSKSKVVGMLNQLADLGMQDPNVFLKLGQEVDKSQEMLLKAKQQEEALI